MDSATVSHKGEWALFRRGFRPFFLMAAIFSLVSMAIWAADYIAHAAILPAGVSPMFWHAHEMVYGYALAVVAGFLLTAVRNWTGIQTLHGLPLLLLVLLWAMARIIPFISGENTLMTAAVLDNLFILYLSVALTIPVARARLWKNMGVISKVYFFLISNVIYALGVFGLVRGGQRIGVFIGLYMILSLILVLARRVLPMFIERGVGYPITLKNRLWVDIACFLLFLVFAVADIFFSAPRLTAWLAAVLCILHAVRLSGWHTPGIWKRPLLWVLFAAYAWMIVGFALKFAALTFGISPSLAVHAFTIGGIGMMTLGMMSRVSLGHTGRNINQPPSGIGAMFALLLTGAFIRVVLPLLSGDHYLLWIGLSQAFWMMAFAVFLYLYAGILVRPRMDGRWG